MLSSSVNFIIFSSSNTTRVLSSPSPQQPPPHRHLNNTHTARWCEHAQLAHQQPRTQFIAGGYLCLVQIRCERRIECCFGFGFFELLRLLAFLFAAMLVRMMRASGCCWFLFLVWRMHRVHPNFTGGHSHSTYHLKVSNCDLSQHKPNTGRDNIGRYSFGKNKA